MEVKKILQKCLRISLICLSLTMVLPTVLSGEWRKIDFSVLTWNIAKDSNYRQNQANAIQYAHEDSLLDVGLVGIQEDFGTHLYDILTGYTYKIKPNSAVGTQLGNGLSVFSDFQLTNEQKVTWQHCNGWLGAWNDCMADKGFVFSIVQFPIELPSGIIKMYPIHFYSLHLDAGDCEDNISGSDSLARQNQLNQLNNFMNANSAGKPVIIVGDFNINDLLPYTYHDVALTLFMSAAPDGQGLTMANDCRSIYNDITCGDSKYDLILFRSGSDPLIKLEKDITIVTNTYQLGYKVLHYSPFGGSDHYPVWARFQLSVNCAIQVTSPNGGESWECGSTQSIKWASNGINDVKIELLKGEAVDTIIKSSIAASPGSYSWVIPSAQAIGNNYRIRISAVEQSENFDVSDIYFSIKSATPLPSLIDNGGFEGGWTGWPEKNGVFTIATQAYQGSKACKLTGFSTGSNLVVNGGFESNWTAWPNRIGIYALSTVKRSGSYSCKLTGQAAAESDIVSNAYPVQGGKSYKLTSYVKYLSGSGNYKVTIAWLNGSGGVISYANDWKGTNKPSAFTLHGGTFQAPGNATMAQIILGVSANTAFLFDDIVLQLYESFESSVASAVYAATAGKVYKLNSYVKYVSGTGNYKVTIAWLNSANGVIRYDNDWKGTNRPANYAYHGGTFTAPANTAKVRVILGAAAGSQYLFDEIELMPQS